MKKILPILVCLLLFGCDYRKDLENSEILPPEAFFAINNWSAQRAYPYGYVNDKKFLDEFIAVKNNMQYARLSSPINTWETMGPHNRGGRTLCIMTNPQNPNTVYAGSASGGLWRSYDQGAPYSWERIVTGYPVLGVNSIAIPPTDSNTIIIGTGEVYSYQGSNIGISVRTNRGSFGVGILKSTDGGNTWNKTLNWQYSEQHGVQIIKFNPLNDNTVWAGTSVGTYKSTDGGNNWNIVDSTLMVTDIEINPLDTNQVLIACGNLNSPGNGVYKTNTGGNTWQQVNGIPNPVVGKIHLCQAPSDPNIVYASVGDGYGTGNQQSNNNTYLCKSLDGGDNWIVVNTLNAQTTEVYDGSTWTNVPSMPVTLGFRVGAGTQAAGLAIGGHDGASPLSTSEWDGSAWTAASNLITGRNRHVGDGNVNTGIVAGGAPSNSTEEYNGSTWAAGGALSQNRYGHIAVGSVNAALAAGGHPGPKDETEEWNGSAWAEGNNLNTARREFAGCGTQTAGLGFAGYGSPNYLSVSEEYDGTSWTEGNDLLTGKNTLGAAGIQTAALAFGGAINPGAASSDVTETYDGSSWTEGAGML